MIVTDNPGSLDTHPLAWQERRMEIGKPPGPSMSGRDRRSGFGAGILLVIAHRSLS